MDRIRPGNNSIRKVSDLPAIEESRNMLFTGRADISRFVEASLVPACESFYDKGIRTLASSCNAKDLLDGNAYIIIDFDTLSEANQAIARTLAEPISYDRMQAVKIRIPITAESQADDIGNIARSIADRFKDQEALWVPTYTLEKMRKIYGIPEDMELTPEAFTEGTQKVWDPEKQVFYDSEELRAMVSK